MLITNFIKKDLLNRAINLSHLGVNELAWKYEDALHVLDELVNKNVIIVGGDVLEKQENTIDYTYDNWYYNGNNLQDSFKQAKEYITNYCLRNGVNYYFVIVIK